MAESFQQYIKIRTFLGYRPKEIHLELQNAFGDEAPTYACVQRWSKRFRDAIDSPLGSPLPSQSEFVHQENAPEQHVESDSIEGEHEDLAQINSNAQRSESSSNTNEMKRSNGSRNKYDKSASLHKQ